MSDTISSEKMAQDQEGIRFHYDLPAEFFKLFLGKSFCYSSGYYLSPDDPLDKAQEQKLALICKKLELNQNDHLLDLGAGWGNTLLYAAQKFGCRVTGVSLSPVQKEYVQKRAQELGVNHLVRYDLVHALALEYPEGTFTKCSSVEGTEHIEDTAALYRALYKVLADDGLMCIQLITGRAGQVLDMTSEAADFMFKHIFPVGRWPTISKALLETEEAGFEIVDVESITDHYYLTQRQWYQNLQALYADKAASTGIAPDRYLAQLLFAAGSVDTFARSTNLLYHFLARKNASGPRRPLQLDRNTLSLEGPERRTPPPLSFTGCVEFQMTGTGEGSADSGNTGENVSAWYVDLANLNAGIQQGHAPDPVCVVGIPQTDLMLILTGQLNWPEAFVQGKIWHRGDLTKVLWVRDLLRSPLSGQ